MLQKIIDGENLTDTIKAFKERQDKGTHLSKLLPTYFKRLIEDIDERAEDWKSETIRRVFKERYDAVF